VRSPSRLVLTGSVLGALVTSGGTAFTMENNVADAAVEVPGFATADDAQATAPSESSLTLGPPVSGAQIAAIALAPARDRAATLAAERAKADAEAAARALDEADEDDDEDDDGGEGLRELQKRFEKACEQGIIEGAVCRGT
jgi:hypothetical protein